MEQPTHTETKKVRIIDSFWTFLIAVACLGPLALPLLWRNPRYKISTKLMGSAAVLALTAWLVLFAKDSLQGYMDLLNGSGLTETL